MAHHRHAARIDILVRLQVIHRAAQSPGPCADGTPLVRSGPGLTRLVEQRMDPVLESVIEIRIDVAVVDGRQSITSRQDLVYRPTARVAASRLLRRAMV